MIDIFAMLATTLHDITSCLHGYAFGVHESFPTICFDTTSERSMAASRRVLHNILLHL
jgi:hypothetical protein